MNEEIVLVRLFWQSMLAVFLTLLLVTSLFYTWLDVIFYTFTGILLYGIIFPCIIVVFPND